MEKGTMRIRLRHIWQRILRFLRLRPLSLAKKCQLTFGVAVVFTLALALLLPYIWMRKLTQKASLDAGRAEAQTLLFRRHFQLKDFSETTLVPLGNTGQVLDVNNPEIRWFRFKNQTGADQQILQQLTEQQQKLLKSLKTETEEERNEIIRFEKKDGVIHSNYARIFRATDSCISCHNPQGSAGAFSPNELIGTIIIQHPAGQISKTILLNWFWVSMAGLIAGTGAIIAFYWITQRVILRPVRQLRAITNNVAEGNLDIRSKIDTGDEYEKLAEAFNHMLDGLQGTQEKLRHANKQLDAKIAELSERNIELFKANKLKSEFLDNISHEFRTPLNAIMGFAQVLRDKAGELSKDKTRRYVDNIITSGNRLLNMINDLLDLAKTRAGKMELHIEKTSIDELINTAVASFSLQTKKKKIKVKVLTAPDLPLLTTDAGKVQQILYNFLSNAMKFTPSPGRIEIRAGFTPPDSSANVSSDSIGASQPASRMVRITVTDTGCGIAEADREKIFEKFRQLDGSLTRQSSGSGLGLAISKELAIMLAGNIGLESEPGKGSTFWLDIPITLNKENTRANE